MCCSTADKNRAERGFGLLMQVTKPSETQVVHRRDRPSQYQRNLLLLDFSEQTDTHHTVPQFIKVGRPKKFLKKGKKKVISRV